MNTNIYKHLFYTWLLAHLLHPVIFGIYCSVIENDQLFFGWDHLKPLLSFTCLGVLVSFPALVISVVSLRIILSTSQKPVVAMIAWILSVLLAINIGAYFMLTMFMGFFNVYFLSIFIPGMIAAVLAILIRYRQFAKLVYDIHERKMISRLNKIQY